MGKSIEARLDLVRVVMELPNVSLADVSRDGRTAVVLSNETGSFQLAAIPLAAGRGRRALSHGKDRVVFARIAHNARQVAFSRDFGGREDYQLFRVPLRGGMETQIAELPRTRIFDFSWSHRDDVIAFSGANQEFNGIWLLDPSSGTVRDVYRGRHWMFGPEFSAGDERICFSARTTDVPTAMELLFLDGAGKGTPTIFTPKPGSENTGAIWHPTEPSVLFKTDARGRYDLAAYEPDGGRLTYLQAGALGLGVDFSSVGWTPDGNGVYYLAQKNGRTRLYTEPLDGSERPSGVSIPAGYHIAKIPPTGKELILSWSSLSRPHAVARYRLDRKRLAMLYRPRAKVPLGRAEPVVYRTFDGRSIHG